MYQMTTRMTATALGVLAVLAAVWADERKLPLDQVPKPVLEAVRARFAGAELTGAAKETEDGKTVYEINVKHKGRKIDVTLTPEGAIELIEKETAAKDLPAPVAKVLEDKYPKAEYKIVEEVIKVEKKNERLAYYEVLLVTADKKSLEVQVAADGKVLKEEKKTPEKDTGS